MPETVTHCPLCNHEKNRHFDSRQFRGYAVYNRVCAGCGLVFQSPRMSSIELEEFYATEYRKVYQGDEGPTEQDLLNQQERAIALQEYVKDTISEVKRHLDIGCSAGILLRTIRNHYDNQATGIEPGDSYRNYAQGHDLTIYVDLDDLDHQDTMRFDLISLVHVLEHLSNPVDYLTLLREQYLTNDGWLLLEVPNLYCHDSFEVAHLVSFSKHTLGQAVQKSGFTIEKLQIHGRPRSEILGLYITLLARPSQINSRIKPDRGVYWKRQFGLFQRRVLQKLFPKQAWIR